MISLGTVSGAQINIQIKDSLKINLGCFYLRPRNDADDGADRTRKAVYQRMIRVVIRVKSVAYGQ